MVQPRSTKTGGNQGLNPSSNNFGDIVQASLGDVSERSQHQPDASDRIRANMAEMRRRSGRDVGAVADQLRASEAASADGHSGERDISSQERAGWDFANQLTRGLVGEATDRQERFTKRHRKGLIGLLISLVIGGGGLSMSFILSGPMEFVQAMKFIDNVTNFLSDAQTTARYAHNIKSLARFGAANWQSNNGVSDAVRRSRVGVVANRFADRTINSLKQKGVELKSGSLGQFRGFEIDTSKTGMSMDVKTWNKIAPDIQIDGTKVTIPDNLNYSQTRRLINQLNDVGRFDIVGKVNTRLALKKIGKISMLHPIKKAEQWGIKKLEDFIRETAEKIVNGGDTIDDIARKKGQEEAEKLKKVDPDAFDDAGNPITDDAKKTIEAAEKQAREVAERALKEAAEEGIQKGAKTGTRSFVKDITVKAGAKISSSGLKVAVPGAGWIILLVEFICAIEAAQEQAGEMQQAEIVNVAEGVAARLKGLGSQVQSGDDLTMDDLGNEKAMFLGDDIGVTDNNGDPVMANGEQETQYDSFWQSAPVLAGLNQPWEQNMWTVPSGLLRVGSEGFAFLNDFGNQALKAYFTVENAIGGLGIACFVIDVFNQVFEFLLTPLLEPLMGLFTAVPGADVALQWISTGMDFAKGFLYGDMLQVGTARPSSQGSIAMYGGKYLSNDQLRQMGATALSDQEEAALELEQRQYLAWEQSQKSLTARLFDASDYNSTIAQIGRAAGFETTSQDLSTHFANVVRLFASTPKLIAAAFSGSSTVYAASSVSEYDYGVPTLAYSETEMNLMLSSDDYEIYTNTNNTIAALESDSNLYDYARKCYGIEISTDPAYRVTVADNQQGTTDSGGWNYVDSYPSGGNSSDCDNTLAVADTKVAATSWNKKLGLRVFIMDNLLMTSADCYENDGWAGGGSADSCTDMGFDLGGSTTSTTSAAGSLPVEPLYEDSTSVACATGTTDLGIYDNAHHDGQQISIRICGIPNISNPGAEAQFKSGGVLVVNSRVSGAFYSMAEAAKADGVTLTAGTNVGGLRSYEKQTELSKQYCGGTSGCGGSHPVAPPGTSNHEIGLAVDFDLPGDPRSDTRNNSAELKWLRANAAEYGLEELSSEDWHWSP